MAKKRTYLVTTAITSYGVSEVEIDDQGSDEANVALAKVVALSREPDAYVSIPTQPRSSAEVLDVIEEA